jgi:hypothetical protein
MEMRSDFLAEHLELVNGVSDRPQQDPVCARLGVRVKEFHAVLGSSDRELSEELAGIASQKRRQCLGHQADGLSVLVGDIHPGCGDRVRIGSGVPSFGQ